MHSSEFITVLIVCSVVIFIAASNTTGSNVTDIQCGTDERNQGWATVSYNGYIEAGQKDQYTFTVKWYSNTFGADLSYLRFYTCSSGTYIDTQLDLYRSFNKSDLITSDDDYEDCTYLSGNASTSAIIHYDTNQASQQGTSGYLLEVSALDNTTSGNYTLIAFCIWDGESRYPSRSPTPKPTSLEPSRPPTTPTIVRNYYAIECGESISKTMDIPDSIVLVYIPSSNITAVTISTCNAGTNMDTQLQLEIFIFSWISILTNDDYTDNDDISDLCSNSGSTGASEIRYQFPPDIDDVYRVSLSGVDGDTGDWVLSLNCEYENTPTSSPSYDCDPECGSNEICLANGECQSKVSSTLCTSTAECIQNDGKNYECELENNGGFCYYSECKKDGECQIGYTCDVNTDTRDDVLYAYGICKANDESANESYGSFLCILILIVAHFFCI